MSRSSERHSKCYGEVHFTPSRCALGTFLSGLRREQVLELPRPGATIMVGRKNLPTQFRGGVPRQRGS